MNALYHPRRNSPVPTYQWMLHPQVEEKLRSNIYPKSTPYLPDVYMEVKAAISGYQRFPLLANASELHTLLEGL